MEHNIQKEEIENPEDLEGIESYRRLIRAHKKALNLTQLIYLRDMIRHGMLYSDGLFKAGLNKDHPLVSERIKSVELSGDFDAILTTKVESVIRRLITNYLDKPLSVWNVRKNGFKMISFNVNLSASQLEILKHHGFQAFTFVDTADVEIMAPESLFYSLKEDLDEKDWKAADSDGLIPGSYAGFGDEIEQLKAGVRKRKIISQLKVNAQNNGINE